MDRTSKRYRTAIAVEHRVFGAAFLALLVFFGWLTYAIFNKRFTDYVEVGLLTSKTGLQLPSHADVKLRGVIVGEVRDRRATADGARLTLGLFPDRIADVPANVSARIQPKTLFGEKFVALQVPEQPAAPIRGGDVIEQTEVSIEVERVLSDIYPLLRTVQPAELNHTLTALATALEGRGEDIGANLTVLNGYLERTNPEIPALVEDLQLLSDVSDTYRSVLPEVARTLRNTVSTGATFVEKEQKIQALFSDVTTFSSTSRDFLEANGQNLIRVAELGEAQLPVFAKHSSIYPCLLDGIVKVAPRLAEAFRGHTLHINLEPLPRQPRGFGPQDDPEYGEDGGPVAADLCRRVINDEWGQRNLPPDYLIPDLDDGVEQPSGKGQSPNRVAPGAQALDPTSGFAGTAAERQVVNALAAPVLGVAVDEVPDLGSLLLGPLARGTEVSLGAR